MQTVTLQLLNVKQWLLYLYQLHRRDWQSGPCDRLVHSGALHAERVSRLRKVIADLDIHT